MSHRIFSRHRAASSVLEALEVAIREAVAAGDESIGAPARSSTISPTASVFTEIPTFWACLHSVPARRPHG